MDFSLFGIKFECMRAWISCSSLFRCINQTFSFPGSAWECRPRGSASIVAAGGRASGYAFPGGAWEARLGWSPNNRNLHTLFRAACFILAVFVLALGCAHSSGKPVKALLTDCSGECYGQIQSALREMTGTRNVNVSREIFKTRPFLLISTYRENEIGHVTPRHAGDFEEKRFMLHIRRGRCALSLIDSESRIVETRDIPVCDCRPENL